MISLYQCALIKDSIIYCNLEKGMSGSPICAILEIVIECCNIISNKPGLSNMYLIWNDGSTDLKDCVIAHNAHTYLFKYSSHSITSCYFCNNTFPHDEREMCVPTINKPLLDADSCKRGSHCFSEPSDLMSFAVTMFYFMI